MNERELLETLCPAIVRIDAGCIHCIVNFVEHANSLLEKAGAPLRYRVCDMWHPQVDVVSAEEYNGKET